MGGSAQGKIAQMMHRDQIDIDADIAREMLFEQFPQYRQEPVKGVGGSTVNAIFKIGSLATARFPLRGADPIAYVNMLRNEAEAMLGASHWAWFGTIRTTTGS